MSVMHQGAALVKPQHLRESLRDELISCSRYNAHRAMTGRELRPYGAPYGRDLLAAEVLALLVCERLQ